MRLSWSASLYYSARNKYIGKCCQGAYESDTTFCVFKKSICIVTLAANYYSTVLSTGRAS
jgi:hypothetical protein